MELFEKLIYLDRDFISAMYETKMGYSPETKITKTEGLNASARIPLISAGVSSVESKSYAISTIGMLKELEDKVNEYPNFLDKKYCFGHPSIICWVNGILCINKTKVTRSRSIMNITGELIPNQESYKDKLIAEEYYFSLKANDSKFTLLPTSDYFSSGVSTFQELANTVVSSLELPVKALIRVYSAQTIFEEWLSVPMVIFDQEIPT